jgi:hypothetical protein
LTDTPKILFQSAPISGALTTLYTSPPSGLGTVIDTMNFCNTWATVQTIRVTTAKGGYQDIGAQTLYNYLPIPSNDTFERTAAIMLGPGDVIRAQTSASGAIVIQGYGVEFS